MKTIKLLLIGILVVATSNIVAQEKQNDATWEETISFLKEYVSRFDVNYRKRTTNTKNNQTYNLLYKITHKITNEGVLIQNERQNDENFYQKVDLKHLKKISKGQNKDNPYFIRLSFDYDIVEYYGPSGDKMYEQPILDLPYYTEIYYIDSKFQKGTPLKDDRLRDKVYKAFQHLAYLATEKRKESKF